MPPPLDIPAPLAAVIVAALTIAVTYLALVDWTHPEDPPR
jgi:hypothetical protein